MTIIIQSAFHDDASTLRLARPASLPDLHQILAQGLNCVNWGLIQTL
jgi:hypothetical protein